MSGLKITDGDDTVEFQLDAALAREAALREELARKDVAFEDLVQSNCDMGQFLAAAEQRNAELVELLHNVSESVTGRNGTFARIPADWFDKRDASLKPTESGASDKCASDGGTCGLGGHCGECPHVESGASE